MLHSVLSFCKRFVCWTSSQSRVTEPDQTDQRAVSRPLLWLARSGRIPIEIVLLVGVPCVFLLIWGLLDPEIKRSLIITPDGDPLLVADPVYDAVRIDDDRVMTVQGQGHLRLWSFAQSAQVGEMLSRMHDVNCLAYSAPQRLLAVGSKTGRVEVWNLNTPDAPAMSNELSERMVTDCQFTPDGRSLLTAGDDGRLMLWDAKTLQRQHTWESPAPKEPIRQLVISNDGQLALAGTDLGSVRVWDLQQRRQLWHHRVAEAHQYPSGIVVSLSFITGNREFIAATRKGGVAVWNVVTGDLIRRFAGEVTDLRTGVLSACGQHYFGGTQDGHVIHWNTATGQRVSERKRHPVGIRALLCNADGTSLLSGDFNGRVYFNRP